MPERKIVFELCAETIDACLAAREGGAARIELCSGLSEGGITPSHGLIDRAVRLSGLPVHVLIRPRGGDFLYSAADLDVMQDDILHAKRLGATGVVLGVLTAGRTIDTDRTIELLALARPMEVTFHRAFDQVPSQQQELETLIELGCDRVLTSGGQPDIVAGAAQLQALVKQADDRIAVAVGGGLRLRNAAAIARRSSAEHFHGSLRQRIDGGGYAITPEAIRNVIENLRGA